MRKLNANTTSSWPSSDQCQSGEKRKSRKKVKEGNLANRSAPQPFKSDNEDRPRLVRLKSQAPDHRAALITYWGISESSGMVAFGIIPFSGGCR